MHGLEMHLMFCYNEFLIFFLDENHPLCSIIFDTLLEIRDEYFIRNCNITPR